MWKPNLHIIRHYNLVKCCPGEKQKTLTLRNTKEFAMYAPRSWRDLEYPVELYKTTKRRTVDRTLLARPMKLPSNYNMPHQILSKTNCQCQGLKREETTFGVPEAGHWTKNWTQMNEYAFSLVNSHSYRYLNSAESQILSNFTYMVNINCLLNSAVSPKSQRLFCKAKYRESSPSFSY